MKLGHKLLLAPVLTAVVVLAAGQLDSWSLSRTAEKELDTFTEDVAEINRLSALQAGVNQAHVDAYRMMTIIGSMEEAAITERRQSVASAGERSIGLLDQAIAQQPAGSPQRNRLEAGRPPLVDYFKKTDAAIDLASVDANTGVAAMQGADEAYQALAQALLTARDDLVQQSRTEAQGLVEQGRRTHWLLSLLALTAAALAVGLSWLVLRRVAQALEQAVGLAHAVADGDLTRSVRTDRTDELGDLLNALGKMAQSLSNTVTQVRSAADGISVASSEIASGNQDLSGRTEQAASSLEQTAASMEELNSTVKNSADAARQANQLASSASAIALRGGEVVAQVVTTMEDINQSSRKINDIIGTIDGIAFQTNILALNAAVEAARAGEQGRGFAVVAGEVRSLAQRSAEAAKEIKALIGASVDKVDAGTRLVGEAGSTMSEIVGSIQRVTDIVGEITAAASEQSDGIGQVNTAVVQLDQMTQQNAALVEQSAAAAESLKDQANRLTQVVSTFRIGAAAGAAVAAARLEPSLAAHSPATGPAPRAGLTRPTAPPTAPTTTPAATPVAIQAPASAPASTPAPATSSSSARLARPATRAATTPAESASAEGDWESF